MSQPSVPIVDTTRRSISTAQDTRVTYTYPPASGGTYTVTSTPR